MESDAAHFFDAVASYKQEKSAEILNRILNRKPFISCQADTEYLKSQLMYSIWNNKCAAYSKLITQIKPKIEEEGKNKKTLEPGEPVIIHETSRW
jgi:hypothetical protein